MTQEGNTTDRSSADRSWDAPDRDWTDADVLRRNRDRRDRLRAMLGSRERLRDLFLAHELLGPPPGLRRNPTGGWEPGSR